MKHTGTRREPIERVIVEDGPPVYTVEVSEDEAHVLAALLGAMGFRSEVEDDAAIDRMYKEFRRMLGGVSRYTAKRDLPDSDGGTYLGPIRLVRR